MASGVCSLLKKTNKELKEKDINHKACLCSAGVDNSCDLNCTAHATVSNCVITAGVKSFTHPLKAFTDVYVEVLWLC